MCHISLNEKKIKSKKKKIIPLTLFILIVLISCITFTSCSQLDSLLGRKKGELIGQSFTVSEYDHFANKTLQVTGTKITIGLLKNSANFNSENTGFKSEVLDISINGKSMYDVGNTIIFAEKGLDMIEDYDIPDEIDVSSGGGFVPFDRYINDLQNRIGKPTTVIIYSQTGIPIGVFQGNKVYIEIPEDLPKTTLLSIDGKALYIHRANYTILDSDLLQ